MEVSKFYTITNLSDMPDYTIGDRLMSAVNELSRKKVKCGQSAISLHDHLEKIGINVVNNNHVGYYFTFDDDFISEELILNLFKDKYQLELKEITAKLDLNKLSEIVFRGLEYLTEEVLGVGKKEPLEEKIGDYVNGLEVGNRTLYITDPYLFPEKCNDSYQKLLSRVLTKSGAKDIIAYSPCIYNTTLFNTLVSSLKSKDISLKHKMNKQFHDRFWICPESKKGFVIGTSLNGISKKVAYINNLEDEDIDEILKLLV